MEPQDKVIFDRWGSYTMKLTPRRLAAEQQAVRKYLAENRPEIGVFFDHDVSQPLVARKERWGMDARAVSEFA